MRYDLVEIYTRHWTRIAYGISERAFKRDRAVFRANAAALKVCNHYQREMQR